MPQIAQAAELAPGTLYLYFSSKNDLCVELLTEGYDRLIERLKLQIAQEPSPRKQAEVLVDVFLEFARDCPVYFNMMFHLFQPEGRGPREGALEPGQVRRLRARERACKEMAIRVLERLDKKAPGNARAKLDAIWSMFAGVVFFFRGAGAKTFAVVAREAKRIMLGPFLSRR